MSPFTLASRVASMTACAAALTVTAAGAAGLRGILSESMPRGLYWTERFTGVVQRGDTVEVCLPADAARLARQRGYLSAGVFCPDGVQRIAKAVLAVPGDTVIVTRHGFEVDGKVVANTRALTRDARGRPLVPVHPGRYRVQPGTVWLFTTEARNSYDSRYYGAVPLDALRRRYHPVWTERHRTRPVTFSRAQATGRNGFSP
jgi:conjugative transfer signal peptidase TraF